MTDDTWQGAILGAALGSLVIPGVMWSVRAAQRAWTLSRPARRALGGVAVQEELCKVFVRDFVIPEGGDLYSITPRLGIGKIPNIQELWPDVEGRAVAWILNVLGQLGKTKNLEVVRMSQDRGEWNANVLVLGAQAQKSLDFYTTMKNVAYRMDNKGIYDSASGREIVREDGFGYGVILKARNPFKTGSNGVGFLIGGFGVLGTGAAAYYFKENLVALGRDFGDDCFGVVVRAPVSAGEQAVERLGSFDKRLGS